MAGINAGHLANEWRERLCRYESTQLTIAEFCIVEGVSVSSFYQWRKKLERNPLGDTTPATGRADFAPVRLLNAANVIVQLPGGTRLEIPMSDCQAFERVMQVVVRADAHRLNGASC